MASDNLARLAIFFYWLPSVCMIAAIVGSLWILFKYRGKTNWRQIVGLVGLCAVGVLVGIIGSVVVNADYAARKAHAYRQAHDPGHR